MKRMTQITAALATLAAALAPAVSHAQAACFALELSPGAPPHPGGLAELTWSESGDFDLTFPGAPTAVFNGHCALGPDGRAHCSINCDGGNLYLTRNETGIEMDFRGFRLESLRFDSIAFGIEQWDADGLSVSGRFDLRPAAPGTCAALARRRPELTLEPGDYSATVERVERALALSGQFAEAPDWLYTAATAEAVRRFQIEMGIEADGRVDPALLRLLGVRVSYGSGGC
ncbi:peptidoglycan-binding domain-containing protein [Pseudogemmobacter sonorensis]|uniref:peptidoglycan-binding domain-containing protein n=1 Tax=Pseudogemmobacter sonorensis TaxID=2989681 RepID=UPI0036CC9CE5